MKITLPLITLLVALCSARPEKAAAKKKQPHRPWDYKFEYLKSKNTLHYLQLSQPSKANLHKRRVSQLQKRNAQYDPTSDLDSQYDPPTFLPPPWSPSSDLDSPYPLSGVLPSDDSGRSEMLDNEPSVQSYWRTCPAKNLDCRKCPRDSRCRGSNLPWWSPTSVLDLPDALTGPQLAGTDSASSKPAVCPLDTCNNADSVSSCGKNARCVRSHCVCDLGFKGATGQSPVVRGLDDLQAVTVWVDPGIACDVPCDSLSCAEVEQVKVCFGKAPETEDAEYSGHEEPETDDVGGGAIQVPGAVFDNGGDYVEGVAALGSYGVQN